MRLSPDQFQEFYDQTARPLKAYLLRLVRNPALADELFQETYYRLLRSDPGPTVSKAYLFRMASNLATDQFRAKREAGGELPELASVSEPSTGDVDKVLSQLKPRERELVWLAYAEGASHREIAEVIGCREASVRPMLYRARQRLTAALKRLGLHERMMV